jgi:hypothetical protein
LPQGPFRQRLRLHLNQPDLDPIDVPVEGVVRGKINIMGRGIDRDTGILRLGKLPGNVDHTRQLWILISGDPAGSSGLTVTQTEPADVLKASLGEPLPAGKRTRQALNIRLASEGRVVNRLGSRQGKFGRVILESNLPEAPRVELLVSFALEADPTSVSRDGPTN